MLMQLAVSNLNIHSELYYEEILNSIFCTITRTDWRTTIYTMEFELILHDMNMNTHTPVDGQEREKDRDSTF